MVEAFPGSLADLDEAAIRSNRDGLPEGERLRHRGRNRLGGLLGALQRRVDDLERRAGRDGEAGRRVRPGKARSGQLGLAATRRGEWRLGLALEAPLDDELRLAVPEQDERRIEARRDRRDAAGRVARRPLLGGAQCSPPRRIVHRSTIAGWSRISSASAGGTSSSSERTISASSRGRVRARYIALMLTSA